MVDVVKKEGEESERGLHVAVLHGAHGSVTNKQVFDTYLPNTEPRALGWAGEGSVWDRWCGEGPECGEGSEDFVEIGGSTMDQWDRWCGEGSVMVWRGISGYTF